ncbi:hypothetical protein V5T82_17085 [Magnetovibrio sp. PR-2]|uniref:hypothetical protein n=1 Tax=Magnetovibrio sp. PR-2 TaxID=3120356 RepID=UPI002FCE0E1A
MFVNHKMVLSAAIIAASSTLFFVNTTRAQEDPFGIVPIWEHSQEEQALIHAKSGMVFPEILGGFQLNKSEAADNEGDNVSVVYTGGNEQKFVEAIVSLQLGEKRSLEQCFKVSSAAFGLRNGNTKPYKTADIKIPTNDGIGLSGKAAAYRLPKSDGDEVVDTRLYMFKIGTVLVKIKTRHPDGYAEGSAMIHNDLLKSMKWTGG